MKILSTGDWHFNAGYDVDVQSSVEQIVNYVAENPVDLVAITGDVYERSSDPDSRNLAADMIRKIADHSPVLVVRGNHDAPKDLKILEMIQSKHAVMVHELPGQYIIMGVMVHTLPWLTKARWVAKHPQATKEEADRTVSQMLLQFITNQVALNPGFKHILVGHLTIAGATAQNHQQLGADGVTLGIYDLQEAGFHASMLGHIHMQQNLSSHLHFYNGSVCALDYGETPDKFFSVLDTKKDAVEWIKLNTIPRYDVSAHWTATGLKVDGVDGRLKGARVRVNLRVEGGDNVKAAKDQLESIMSEAQVFEHKLNIQVLNPTQLRAAEIAMAQDLKDKLEQFWKATTRPDEKTQADMLAKLAQLEEELCSQSH